MPMTLVVDGDDEKSISTRLGIPTGPIEIDSVIVDAFSSRGVGPEALRKALVAHRPDFARRKASIPVAGSKGIELFGNLEGGSFRLDRMVCGDVTYFSTRDDAIAHAVDYGRMDDESPLLPECAAGRRMRDVLRDSAFRSKRSPRIASAQHVKGDPLRLDVERTSTQI